MFVPSCDGMCMNLCPDGGFPAGSCEQAHEEPASSLQQAPGSQVADPCVYLLWCCSHNHSHFSHSFALFKFNNHGKAGCLGATSHLLRVQGLRADAPKTGAYQFLHVTRAFSSSHPEVKRNTSRRMCTSQRLLLTVIFYFQGWTDLPLPF